jgi:hypothetical protein
MLPAAAGGPTDRRGIEAPVILSEAKDLLRSVLKHTGYQTADEKILRSLRSLRMTVSALGGTRIHADLADRRGSLRPTSLIQPPGTEEREHEKDGF